MAKVDLTTVPDISEDQKTIDLISAKETSIGLQPVETQGTRAAHTREFEG